MPIDYTPELQAVLKILETSADTILLTGKAGTGKSTLLREFRARSHKNLVVLAPTGVAALNVSGETIHSFFSIAPNATSADIEHQPLSYPKQQLIRKLDAIIIDEISMVRADLIDLIDLRLRATHNRDKAFGGLQLIMIGDLYQLPPVLTNSEKSAFSSMYDSPYFFSSRVMRGLDIRFIELTKVYRQQDAEFIDILNSIRTNTLTESDLKIINARFAEDVEEILDSFTIYLATTNKIVQQVNSYKLAELSSSIMTYKSTTTGQFPLTVQPTGESLVLKVGAQVMFLNNEKDPESESYRWVNGTLGKIIDIAESSKTGEADTLVVELVDGKIVEVLPYTWRMEKHSFDASLNRIVKNTVGTYTQYPVQLAWAVTIHKAQGKTFSKLIIDLGYAAFDYGQVYVALSRATSLEGITLRRPVTLADIKVDSRVGEFLANFQA